jgi:DNA polymerase-3 subunit epsilon
MHDYLSAPFPEKSAAIRDIEIVAMDFETTGLDPDKDSILSVGLVTISDLGIRLASSWHQIICINCEIPESSAVIHGITDDEATQGQPLETVIAELLPRLAGKVLLVHHKAMEQNFLTAACQRLYQCDFIAPIIDTEILARRSKQRREETLQRGDLRLFNLREQYRLPRYSAHNAYYDALATAELFLAMAAEYCGDNDCTLGDFLC